MVAIRNMRSALRGVCARSFYETSRPFPPTFPVKQPLDRPAGVGLFRTWLRPPVYGVSSVDRSSRQSIPSLPGTKNDPGAWRSSSPRRRADVCQMNLRDASHRAVAPRREMARILLEVSGNTGLPHLRLLFRESCERAVASPDQYGSAAQRTSDYGDHIKGSLECQPMPASAGRRSGRALRAAESCINGSHLAAFVRAGAANQTRPINGRPVGARGRRRSRPRRRVAAPRSGRAPVAPGPGGGGRAAR